MFTFQVAEVADLFDGKKVDVAKIIEELNILAPDRDDPQQPRVRLDLTTFRDDIRNLQSRAQVFYQLSEVSFFFTSS